MKTRSDPNDRLSIAAGAPTITTVARAGGAAGRATSLPPTMEETDVCEHLDTHRWIGALRPGSSPWLCVGQAARQQDYPADRVAAVSRIDDRHADDRGHPGRVQDA